MTFAAYFMVDPSPDATEFIFERARQAGLEFHPLRSHGSHMELDWYGGPCMHYILGFGRSDYAFEADTAGRAMEYADDIFGGLTEEEAFIRFYGIIDSDFKKPEQMSFNFDAA